MDNSAIFDKIKKITTPQEGYLVFRVDNDECFFGKDASNNIVFMLESRSQLSPITQSTKSLSFCFNKNCQLILDGQKESKIMHILLCKEHDDNKLLAFIRLTYAFSSQGLGHDQFYLARLFASLSDLFGKNRNVSEMELQGLYAELYTILYLKDKGIDIAHYWQSKNKMKFDFSINSKKRLEIKSTLKPERIHHFKHDQLQSQLYDIKVVSLQLQKNDYGVSLLDLVERTREVYADNFAFLMRIEAIIGQVETSTMEKVKYDKTYTDDRIRFYDAIDIPHFNQVSPEGVFNAEYDCVLDGVKNIELKKFGEWITEG